MINELQLGFASYKDRSFELIVRDNLTYEEVTLTGKLNDDQFECVGKVLPSCVYVNADYLEMVSIPKDLFEATIQVLQHHRTGESSATGEQYENHSVCEIIEDLEKLRSK